MDESLANGFKNQFFRDIEDDLNKAISRGLIVYKKSNQYSKLTNWEKFTKSLILAMKEMKITHCIGGSKRKPFLVTALLGVDQNRPYNAWNEKCLLCYDNIFNFDPPFYKRFESTAYIGEHAVKRIYQRSFDAERYLKKEITNLEILKELKYVPLWSNFWPQLFYYLNKRLYKIQTLKPIIPTPNGLFLCEYSTSNKYHLDIRSFVNKSQLDERQTKLRNVLLKASKKHVESPVCFLSTLLSTGINCPVDDLHSVSMALINHSKLLAEQISNDADFGKHLQYYLIRTIDKFEEYLMFEKHPLPVGKNAVLEDIIESFKN